MMKFALITSSHGKYAEKMAEKKGSVRSVFDYCEERNAKIMHK